MNIIEESFREQEEKPKKRKRLLLTLILLIFIAIITIIIVLIVMKEPDRVYYVDGVVKPELGTILKEQSGDSFYVPIKQMAPLVGYAAYNGDYGIKSEEINKCYIENDDEIVTLTLNSKRIYRIRKSQDDDNNDYEYYDMKNEVKSINGELCIESEEMPEIFNVQFIFNKERNKIFLSTLSYLVQSYQTTVLDYGYKAIDKEFINQKAILKDMIVVTKEDDKEYGVVKASTGETILEPKYTGIEYMPSIGDFIVEDDDKYGIISPSRENKIPLNYDGIDLIDKDAGLYAVQKENKYGVVDLKGASKISVEFDEIGINMNDFKENDIKNKYLLVDNLIPVKKGQLWGLFDKKGNKVVDFYYDSFGYIASSNENAKNLLVIPKYNVIVARKDKKYALINQSGQPLFAPVVDDIYMIYEDKRYQYIMNYNNETMDAEEYLKQRGATSGSTSSSSNNTGDNNNQQQLTQEQMQQQQMQQQQMQQQQQQEQQQLTQEQLQQQQMQQQQMQQQQMQQQQMQQQQMQQQ